jgi:hypothetical protein
MLFCALLASGQINMRKVDGWQTLATNQIDQQIDDNLLALDAGYITRNGDYSAYIVISEGIGQICNTLNSFKDVSIPRNPNNLGSRLGFLKLVLGRGVVAFVIRMLQLR